MLKMMSISNEWYFISNLTTIVESLGIREHVPNDTKFLKYSVLKGKDIRIMNRLTYFIDRNQIKDVRKLFNKFIFTQKVISTKKECVIELISEHNFTEVLRKYKIVSFLIYFTKDKIFSIP